MASIFISWSGAESQGIAVALRNFLKLVLPDPDIFVSSEDIPGGKPWFAEIARAIDTCNAGIIVTTASSISRPWLHFEAGAIAKHIEQSFVIPLLCGIAPGKLNGTPLAQFQAMSLTKADLPKICTLLSQALGFSTERLQQQFDVWWEKLGHGLLEMVSSEAGEATEASQPTTADLAARLEHLVSTVDSMVADVRRTRNDISPGIMGQGALATASPSEAARIIRPYLGDGTPLRPPPSFTVETKKKRRALRPPSATKS